MAGVTLTIRDASRATGLSVKAIQRRIERGSLPSELVDGVRRIPLAALMASDLLVRDGTAARAAPGAPRAATPLVRRIADLEARLAEVEAELARRRPDGE